MSADELLHQIKHAASQQSGDDVPVAFGHIASYDPKLHRVRLIIPSWRDEAGNPVLTPWMPITTAWSGSGFGMQFAPVGGATQEKPTQGEPCVMSVIRRNQGLSVQAGLFFNQANEAPFPDLKPGEGGMKHQSGSFLRFTKDGDILVDAARDLIMQAVRDVTISAGRDMLAVALAGNAGLMASNGTATMTAMIAVVHGATSLALDAGGTGVQYTPPLIISYSIGASSSVLPINPPQIP